MEAAKIESRTSLFITDDDEWNALVAALGLGAMGQLGLANWAMILFVLGFSATVLFQIINLPVEFNASSRAKTELVALGIINSQELTQVSSVLTAAAMTYVAATLQAVATLAYYVLQFVLQSQSRRD